MSKLYTGRGDAGTTTSLRDKGRFAKDSALFAALGTIDELNSLLGLCRHQLLPPHAGVLRTVQEHLFIIQAELAGAPKALNAAALTYLETNIEAIEAKLTVPTSFLVPGSTVAEAWSDYARTIVRRAERAVVELHRQIPIAPPLLAYLNRLSSLLYAIARAEAQHDGQTEEAPHY